MPNVQRLIADKGTTFTRNYSPDPICCPARATVLTGQYPHNHGVLDNVWPNTDPYELRNLANEPAFEWRLAAMSARLDDWRSCAGLACR
jgi:arylsulfatase A-like enzyme